MAWRCKVCDYVYEGDELPEDYVCFEEINE